MRTIATLLLLACLSNAAVACLNDRDSRPTEENYQRQYEPQDEQPRYVRQGTSGSPVALASMGIGGALLGGSLIYSLFRKIA